MTKLIAGFFVLLGFSVFAEMPYVAELPQFKANNLTILWDAPTNQLGASLWVYKVTAQNFSADAINYLLKIGGLTNTIKQSQALSVANSSNTCQLTVVPELGYIRYWDGFAAANHWDKTNHLVEPVVGLPATNEIQKLGLRLLKRFGIQPHDLAQRGDGRLITFGEMKTRGYYDRRKKQFVEDEVITRGIFFSRRLNGINFLGIGSRAGCEIEFGNNAKVSEFTMVWRNYEPYQCFRIANTVEVIQQIHAGNAILTRKNLVNQSDVKSLTITKVEPSYIGASELEKQGFLYPLAKVEATADFGTNRIGIELYCPILSTNIYRGRR